MQVLRILVCFAVTTHGRKVQTTGELRQSELNRRAAVPNPTAALESLLVLCNPLAGWQVGHGCNSGVLSRPALNSAPVDRAKVSMRLNKDLTRRSALAAAAATALMQPRAARAEKKSKLGYDLDKLPRDTINMRASELTGLQRKIAFDGKTEEQGLGKTTNGYFWSDKTEGYYIGAISKLPLFSSQTRYVSAVQWLAFEKPVDDEHVIIKDSQADIDNFGGSKSMTKFIRKDIIDPVSGAHLGDLFKDTDSSTGVRYTINANALTFVPSPNGEVPKGGK